MASSPTSIPERGQLRETPLPRILLELYHSRFEGHLHLTRDRVEKKISLRQGAPVASTSNLSGESLGAQLLESGKLSRVDQAKVDSYIEQQGCEERVALLSLKLLDPKQLFTALKEQLRRQILDCFGWTDGGYQLLGDGAVSEGTEAFRTDPYRLVQEGLTAHWSPDRMLQGLAAEMERFPRPTRPLDDILDRLQLDGEPRELLSGLSGTQTLGRALAPAWSSPPALAAIWVLDAAHLLSYSDRPGRAAADGEADLDTEIEIAIIGSELGEEKPAAVDPDAAAAAPPGPPANQGSRPLAPTQPEAQALREEIWKYLEQLDDLDYYSLLDVMPDAETGAIRKAYFSAAKRYHPDALARLGLDDIKEEAATVFTRMAEAKKVLSDKNKRAEYDASRDSVEPSVDVARLAQAETFFRKGEILINMGDFKGALEYLQPAVELWPGEATYQSALGWAHYKKAPAEPELALVHLQKAQELAPDDSVTQFRLELVERTLLS